MDRTHKNVGQITFVGAGPGDPGLLTRRAVDALTAADRVSYDRRVPEPLLAAVRAEVRPGVEVAPAEGEVAKSLLAAAEAGEHIVHLVPGDPFGQEGVVN